MSRLVLDAGPSWRSKRRSTHASSASGRAAVGGRARDVEAPDEAAARRAGELLARTRTRDVVDALLVGLARAGDTILTSDPKDIAMLVAAAGARVTVLTV
jgi:hypothetical protein